MRCELFTSLQEAAADSLPTSSLDIPPSAPSSGTTTLAKSCEQEPPTDGSPVCQCTKEIYGCSTHPNTPDEWTASMRASLVKILAQPENAQALAKAHARISTLKPLESFAKYDRATSSWKTCQQSFLEECSQLSWETWPKAGLMKSDGSVFALPKLALTITGIDGGVWPTPLKSAKEEAIDAWVTRYKEKAAKGIHLEMPLSVVVQSGKPQTEKQLLAMWPTPNANDAKVAMTERSIKMQSSGKVKMDLPIAAILYPTPTKPDFQPRRISPNWKGNDLVSTITEQEEAQGNMQPPAGGKLNPTWVEWIMGWPLGYTALKPSATVKFHSKRQLRGKS